MEENTHTQQKKIQNYPVKSSTQKNNLIQSVSDETKKNKQRFMRLTVLSKKINNNPRLKQIRT